VRATWITPDNIGYETGVDHKGLCVVQFTYVQHPEPKTGGPWTQRAEPWLRGLGRWQRGVGEGWQWGVMEVL
jgi:hypothetical protein